MLVNILWAIFLGVVEGVTEWLPVSSTGHLILLQSLLDISLCDGLSPELYAEFCEMFDVIIQLGAILAVVVRFFARLWPLETVREGGSSCDSQGASCNNGIVSGTNSVLSAAREASERCNSRSRLPALRLRRETVRLWGLILAASLPAAIAGLVIDRLIEHATGRDIDGWLYNPPVVAAALIAYGVLFILTEKLHRRAPVVLTADSLGTGRAAGIGVCQMMAIIPGTSRSGATILGAMLLGLSRTAAAEFSFLMAVPAMAGAGLVKALGFAQFVSQNHACVPLNAWIVLATAALTAFAVSTVTIGFLTDFVKKHTFAGFGVYRIILGAAVLIYYFWGT